MTEEGFSSEAELLPNETKKQAAGNITAPCGYYFSTRPSIQQWRARSKNIG